MREFYERIIKPESDRLGKMLNDVTIPYVRIPNETEDFWARPALEGHRHTASFHEGRKLYCADCGEELVDLDEEQDFYNQEVSK